MCDPAAGDRIVFGVQAADAHFAPTGQQHYGEHFLFVDGSCRWFAGRADVDPLALTGQVRTGVLGGDELAALNEAVLTGPWDRIDARHRAWGGPDAGSDAATTSLWRDDLGARCYSGCPGEWTDFWSLFRVAIDWERELAERGAPFDGPIRLVSTGVIPGGIAGAHPWTGTTDLGRLRDGYQELLVEDPTDAATLRRLRSEAPPREAIRLRVEELDHFVYAVDALPHADAEGRVRPPF